MSIYLLIIEALKPIRKKFLCGVGGKFRNSQLVKVYRINDWGSVALGFPTIAPVVEIMTLRLNYFMYNA